jgi:hypothetical protein
VAARRKLRRTNPSLALPTGQPSPGRGPSLDCAALHRLPVLSCAPLSCPDQRCWSGQLWWCGAVRWRAPLHSAEHYRAVVSGGGVV